MDLDIELEGIFDEFSLNVEEAVENGVMKCGREVNKVITETAKNSNFGGTGKYIKAFTITKAGEKYNPKCIWHVKKPFFRLTHLLENGHTTRSGGRTRAFPHVSKGAEFAQQNAQKYIREEIEKI